VRDNVDQSYIRVKTAGSEFYAAMEICNMLEPYKIRSALFNVISQSKLSFPNAKVYAQRL